MREFDFDAPISTAGRNAMLISKRILGRARAGQISPFTTLEDPLERSRDSTVGAENIAAVGRFCLAWLGAYLIAAAMLLLAWAFST